MPEKLLAYALAAVVLGGVALTSFGWVPVPHRRNLVLAGATSGLLGTATSIGGPPMALVWQNSTGARLRGTMSGFFLVGSVLSLVLLALTGSIGHHTVVVFAHARAGVRLRLCVVPVGESPPGPAAPALGGDRDIHHRRRGADRPPIDRRLN